MPRRSGLTLSESSPSARKPSGRVDHVAAFGPSRKQAWSCTVALAAYLAVGLDPIAASAQLAVDATQEVQLDELTVQGKSGPRLVTDGYLAKQSVSATRTDTPLREVPQAVVVVPNQVLEDAAATRIDTALNLAGVGRANNFAGLGLTEFTIRGFATGEYYRNGFPINRGYPNSPDIASIERVEVLKGPSAFLYGRGDPGGTFNIVSKQPLAERSFTVDTQYGSFNTKRSTVDATGALDENGQVLARITGAVEDNGSFRDFGRSDRYYLAPAIAWKPTADTTITLEGELISAGQIFDRGIVPFRGDLRAVPRTRYIGEPGLAPFRNDNALGQLRIEHRFDPDWVLTAGTQVLAGNIAGDAVQTVGVLPDGRTLRRTFDHRELTWSDVDLQVNLAGKFETGPFRHTLLLGLEYDSYRYREVINRSNPTTNPFFLDLFAPRYGQVLPPLTVAGSNLLENTQSYAGYVQDQIDITPRLHALVGVRVEDIGLVSTSYITNRTTSLQGTAATPRFGLVYDLLEAVSVYGNYARSFRPNTGTDRNFRPFAFQEGEGYEVGAKFDLLDGRLNATAALFEIKRTNVLTTDPVDQNFSVAAGEIRSRGFDLTVAGYLAPGWRVIGTYTYADAAVTRDNTIPVGSRIANVPENAFALQSVYEFQGGDLRGLGLGAGVNFVGQRAAGTAVSTFNLPEYTLLNLISYYRITPDVRVYLNVDNVFDTIYYDRAWQNRYATPGTPRTIMGGVAARF
ncbi:TonB-dependent siderophore receptor [Methylobacterium organophilum]|uniref:TonB-dependent siderophore receptor n=1 Tax=Methylobacterium organophilum TaxID=410 RepID=UPI001F13C05D|nr:TonB-dependent siderophore receptor [Methylobacterium organophilum]UMY16130.1 TonB-dependent siderophore receptor [Methylobacterium organophilum]